MHLITAERRVATVAALPLACHSRWWPRHATPLAATTCYTARMNTHTPSEPTESVRAWLAKVPASQEPVVTALRTLVRTVVPDAHEIVYHDALGYGPLH